MFATLTNLSYCMGVSFTSKADTCNSVQVELHTTATCYISIQIVHLVRCTAHNYTIPGHSRANIVTILIVSNLVSKGRSYQKVDVNNVILIVKATYVKYKKKLHHH